MTSAATATLTLENVHVTLGARRILHDVSMTLEPGRIHALVGENGAGKSTLLRVCAGLIPLDSGQIRTSRALPSGDAQAATREGIGVVHQHFMLVEQTTVARNIALGVEPRKGPLGLWIDTETLYTRVKTLAAQHALEIDPNAQIESLSVGERQRVELLRVLYRGARYVLLDEPTAVLAPHEIDSLLDTLRALARDGAAVLLVTHKLREVFAVADHITVLRQGRVVLSLQAPNASPEQIADAVMGVAAHASTQQDVGAGTHESPSPRLVLQQLEAPRVHEIDLTVNSHEIVGIAGVEGSGQRELFRLIAGLDTPTRGTLSLGSRNVSRLSVLERRSLGLGYVPEDREGSGLLPDLSVQDNLALGDPSCATSNGWLARTQLRTRAHEAIEQFAIRPPDPALPVRFLSGGNAQKVLMARELLRSLQVLLVAQPTRGIDIAAARLVHQALRTARTRGVAILLVSSELDELRSLCDRVLVMRQGRIVANVAATEATDANLGVWMVGGRT